MSGLGEAYECWVCHGTFTKTRSDEEAAAEMKATWQPADGDDDPGIAWTRVGAMNAHKLTSYIEVPNELLMIDGVIPDTRPPRPPLPWSWRARQKLRACREQAARIAYRAIAGQWPDNGEDDW